MDPAGFVQLSAPVTVLRTPTSSTDTQKIADLAIERSHTAINYVVTGIKMPWGHQRYASDLLYVPD